MAAVWDQQGASGVLDNDSANGGAGRWPRPGVAGRDATTARAADRDRRAWGTMGLDHAVEAQIVPRLVLSRRLMPKRLVEVSGWAPTAGDVLELADCAVRTEAAAGDYIATLRARGAGVEAVFLDLLAPAARQLGTYWDDDSLSFVDVTIGLVRLHQVMRALAPDFRAEAAPERPGRRALLVPAPGEQHSFGLAMVAEFFRRAGWGVWTGRPDSRDELLSIVRAEPFGVIGFSVACGTQLDSLASCIRRVRAVSRNPSIGVLVGGPVFSLHPELAVTVGADATASDGRHAAFQAEGLLALQPVQR